MSTGSIYSICIASERGQLKKEVSEARVLENWGIENDGHAGDWGRQVTCLDWASVVKANQKNGLHAGPGDFAENILLTGCDLKSVAVGGKLKLGDDVILEVTQIGKEDHPSVVTRTLGVTLLPYEGLFCKVVKGGKIAKGDTAQLL